MPGQFPAETPLPGNSDIDAGDSPPSLSSSASSPRSRTLKDVYEELRDKEALLECITSEAAEPFEIELLKTEILSLQEELSQLAMEQPDDHPYADLAQRLGPNHMMLPDPRDANNSVSPAPGSEGYRKRGYSQVDQGAGALEGLRQLAQPSTDNAVFTLPFYRGHNNENFSGYDEPLGAAESSTAQNSAPQGQVSFHELSDEDFFRFSSPSLGAGPSVGAESNALQAPVLQNPLAAGAGPAVGGQSRVEIIDLTASDDEEPSAARQSHAPPPPSSTEIWPHSRVKLHSRNPNGWAYPTVKKEEEPFIKTDPYQQPPYPGSSHPHYAGPATAESPIEIFDDGSESSFTPPPYQWPLQPAFQQPLYQPYNAAAMTQALKIEEQAQVTKILEHLSEDAEYKQPSDRLQTPPALNVKLMEHQKVGLTWLVKQEESNNCGGILADDMGLGKTIQALALILHRPSEQKNRKTTLIVCPVSLMAQWQREIEEKVKHEYALETYIYHGQQPKRYKDFNVLKQYDVILTSYGTIAGEYKKKMNAEKRLQRLTSKDYPFLSKDSFWYRVILDESQHVKNHQTLTSRACAELQAKYRICLSGTPMQNSIDDLYGAVRFLGLPRYRLHRNWTADFSSQLRVGREVGENAMRRLHALIKAIMLRRKKDSMIDNKPILTLPAKTIEIVHPVFSEDEQALYQAVEGKIGIRFNKYLEDGAVPQSYTYFLLLLLRLRQLCCHPRMIKDLSVQLTAEEKTHQQSLIDELTPETIARLKSGGLDGCPICYEVDRHLKIVLPCGHQFCQECLADMANQSNANAMAAGDEHARAIMCPTCRGPLDTSRTIDWVVFQQVHMPEQGDDLTQELDKQLDDALGGEVTSEIEDSESEDEDGSPSDLEDFIVNDDEELSVAGSDDTIDELEVKASTTSSTTRRTRKVKKEAKDRVKLEDSDNDEPVDKPAKKSSQTSRRLKIEDSDTDEATNAADSDSDSGDDIMRFLAGEDVKLKPRKGKNKGKKIDPFTYVKKEKKQKKKKKDIKGKKAVKKEDPKRGNTLSDDRRLALRNKRARGKYFRDLARNWTTSAKIDKVLEILRKIRENDPKEKTIVFSSFTSFLDLLQIPLQRDEAVSFERYDGSMSAKDRNDAVLNFGDNPDVNVMLISLKAGNTGLNMTAASQVIIIEPWWNPFVEEQAIDRAHRIGQLRPVIVHRLIIENTVEDRIMTLQEAKREIIAQAMDEEARKNISKLSMRDLVYLFTGRENGR
ncbi:hypothetical protein ABW21_db0208600 [Orbilia brochopaga]|nr:hypothetical protein ABW21_db0208600 [Drechslerella brochopaga]